VICSVAEIAQGAWSPNGTILFARANFACVVAAKFEAWGLEFFVKFGTRVLRGRYCKYGLG
jgi:hypothetical protein